MNHHKQGPIAATELMYLAAQHKRQITYDGNAVKKFFYEIRTMDDCVVESHYVWHHNPWDVRGLVRSRRNHKWPECAVLVNGKLA